MVPVEVVVSPSIRRPVRVPSAVLRTMKSARLSPFRSRRCVMRNVDPAGITSAERRAQLDLIGTLNRSHLERHGGPSDLDARIESYELAFRMQSAGAEAFDLSRETRETAKLYGLNAQETSEVGTCCLLARRLVERGVRFVQLYHNDWDHHGGIKNDIAVVAREVDQGMAALLRDLKQRGMLQDTLVVWGGEFGRTPMTEGSNGRDHNPHGFSMWMAGGGVKGGQVIGATDAVGLRAEQERTHVHDLHATILHLMGMDHTRMTYRHQGRAQRLTDVAGVVVQKALA